MPVRVRATWFLITIISSENTEHSYLLGYAPFRLDLCDRTDIWSSCEDKLIEHYPFWLTIDTTRGVEADNLKKHHRHIGRTYAK